MVSKTPGRRGKRWQRLRAEVKARGGPCCRCGMRIDYGLHYPHPESFSVDHLFALATHPWLAEEPTNLAPAHLRCNQSAGASGPTIGLGHLSEDW